MMFEIRSPTIGIPVRRANCPAISSPVSFESAYDDSGLGSIVSSIGANAGGVSNGNPRTVSDDAQTTRSSPCASAAAKMLYVDSALIRNVSAGGRVSGGGGAPGRGAGPTPPRAPAALPALGGGPGRGR